MAEGIGEVFEDVVESVADIACGQAGLEADLVVFEFPVVFEADELAVFGRGSHERIDVFPGAELTSNYSGNTVDICPVGALLNRDFRFRARAWFAAHAETRRQTTRDRI